MFGLRIPHYGAVIWYCCFKKNLNAPRPSEHPPVMGEKISKRLGGINSLLFLTFSALVASPEKLLYTVANPARGLLNSRGKKKKKSLAALPLPRARAARSEKVKIK